MNKISKVIALLQEKGYPRDEPFPVPSEEALEKAQSSLGIKFPESYMQFLREATHYTLHTEEFLWVDEEDEENIMTINFEERAQEGGIALPAYFVSFMSDGYGTQICFDTRDAQGDGEFPIVEWEVGMMEAHLNAGDPAPVATDFSSWILDKLRHELEFLDEDKRE